MSVTFVAGNLELNLSNDRAEALIGLLGLQDEQCSDLAKLRRRILLALNTPKLRELYVIPSRQVGNTLYCGIDDAYLVRRLKDLDEIVRGAQFLGVPLRWS